MEMEKLLQEQRKSAERYQTYKALTSYPEWKYFVEDMKEIISLHESASVICAQKNLTFETQKQAFIIMGIQECLEQPKDFMEHHENFFMKVKRAVCNSFGSLFQSKAA